MRDTVCLLHNILILLQSGSISFKPFKRCCHSLGLLFQYWPILRILGHQTHKQEIGFLLTKDFLFPLAAKTFHFDVTSIGKKGYGPIVKDFSAMW